LAVSAESLPLEGDVEVGTPLYLGRAGGALPLGRLEGAKAVALIGIGTGVAPLRATVQHLLALPDAVDKPYVILLQGARSLDECYFYHEFVALEGRRFSYRPVYSRGAGPKGGRMGRVQQHLLDLPTDGVEYCLCGSAAMVAEVRSLLEARGVSPECVFSEGY
jgi:NAD(P)H-flavin reductase